MCVCGDATWAVGGGRDVVPELGAAGSLLCALWGCFWGKEVRADAHPVGWGGKSSTWKLCSKSRVSLLELFQIHIKQVGLLCPVGSVFCGDFIGDLFSPEQWEVVGPTPAPHPKSSQGHPEWAALPEGSREVLLNTRALAGVHLNHNLTFKRSFRKCPRSSWQREVFLEGTQTWPKCGESAGEPWHFGRVPYNNIPTWVGPEMRAWIGN